MALLREYKEIAYQWGIWKTEESTEELLALLPDPERYEQQLTRFSSPHRKLEWLSVRVLLYQLLGEEKIIEYAPSGKPRLADSSYFISISHTRGYVAVILSPGPKWESISSNTGSGCTRSLINICVRTS